MKARSGLLLLSIVIGGLLVLGVWAGIVSEQKWAAFKIEHNCKIVEKYHGSDSIGFNTDGTTTIILGESKTGWLCNDGITYWR